MHHLLAGTRTRLTYLCGRRALAKINWPAVYDDLTDAGAPLNYWRWCDLDALSHVVLAIDQETGRHIGVLGLVQRSSPEGSRLLIETALLRPGDGDGPLLRALLAHVLVRIASLEGKPDAIVAAPSNRAALRDLHLALRSTTIHPPADGAVIVFHTAVLARQIGDGRTVLDLRPVSETALLRDLRRLHGVRRERAMDEPSTGKAARTGGAMRRPRKATRTGMIG